MTIINGDRMGHGRRLLEVTAVAALFALAPRTCQAGSRGQVALGVELGADRSTLEYDPKQSDKMYGWTWGPEMALVGSYRVGDTWGIDGSVRICARGGTVRGTFDGDPARVLIESRVAAARCLLWKAVAVGAWEPRIGLGGQLEYLLRSQSRLTSARRRSIVPRDQVVTDLDFAPVISVGVGTHVSGVALGVELAYMFGVTNTNDGPDRDSVRISNRSMGVVLRVSR